MVSSCILTAHQVLQCSRTGALMGGGGSGQRGLEAGPLWAGRVHSLEISVRGCGGWGLPQSFLFTVLIYLLSG